MDSIKTSVHLLPIIFLMLLGKWSKAQNVYKLWEGIEKPYFKENNIEEYEEKNWGVLCTFNVTEPSLTVYKAKGKNLGKAVIIIPGGGYNCVAMRHEGYEVAEILSSQGITAAVLKYRIPDPKTSDQPHLVAHTDARRALALLREKSDQYEFDKNKVGLIGFSAGSHLATVVSLWQSENIEENPNYTGLIYGVTNLSEANQKWLEENVYFRKMKDNEIIQNRLIDLVSKNTPPAFLVHAYNDDVCFVEETILYSQKLTANKILVETHIFSEGGHGFGIGRKEDGTEQWISLFVNWIKTNNL